MGPVAERGVWLAPESIAAHRGDLAAFVERAARLDAAAVIWQWQAVHDSVTVWPPQYAIGSPKFVPLPR